MKDNAPSTKRRILKPVLPIADEGLGPALVLVRFRLVTSHPLVIIREELATMADRPVYT